MRMSVSGFASSRIRSAWFPTVTVPPAGQWNSRVRGDDASWDPGERGREFECVDCSEISAAQSWLIAPTDAEQIGRRDIPQSDIRQLPAHGQRRCRRPNLLGERRDDETAFAGPRDRAGADVRVDGEIKHTERGCTEGGGSERRMLTRPVRPILSAPARPGRIATWAAAHGAGVRPATRRPTRVHSATGPPSGPTS